MTRPKRAAAQKSKDLAAMQALQDAQATHFEELEALEYVTDSGSDGSKHGNLHHVCLPCRTSESKRDAW